jgi:DNA repair photolyase
MNKTKGNMYPFITATWNPLAGACPHGCSYCSTNKLMRYDSIKAKYSGLPRLDEKQLTNLGKGNFIFVCAQNDLFAKGISTDIILPILHHCAKFDNKYLFQTKNPDNVLDFINHPAIKKSVICTTIESDMFYPDIMCNTPQPMQRSMAMDKMSRIVDTYVTIEPIMDFHLEHFVQMIHRCNPKQVNIGADSGKNNLPEPSKEKVLQLIAELEKFTKVVQKSNLKRLLK